jgi:hypothetical protein
LIELRKKGRYLIGLHNRNFIVKESDAAEMLAVTRDLIGQVEKLLSSIDYFQKPPIGEYIKFGSG